MRRLVAGSLMLALVASTQPAFAQQTRQVEESTMAKAAVREGVRMLRDHAASMRSAQGWGNIVGGLIMGGLSGWLLVDGISDDSTGEVVLGSAFGVVAASNIVSGIYTLGRGSAIEQTSVLILESDKDLATTGYILLAHEAERARQERILGGMLGIASSLGSGLLLIPVLTDDQENSFVGLSDTVWVIIISSTGVLGVVNGAISLLSESVPEQIFGKVKSVVGRSEVSWMIGPGAIRDSEQEIRPALTLGVRF